MGMYELDDDKVREFVTHQSQAGWGNAIADAVAAALEEQMPIPVPEHIGAVVATDSTMCAPDLSVFIRWASDAQTPVPWILREELDLKTFGTEEIGRIVEVLSEGWNPK